VSLDLSSLLLLFEISDLLNILLIIVTLGTVRYASKTLLMEYSSQIYISRYRLKLNSQDELTHTWEVDIENKGRGYIVKGFILLSVKSKKNPLKKEYHLSKPIVDIDPGEKDIIELKLKESHFDDFDLVNDKVEVEVYYQDALNKIYVVSPGAIETNKHLEKFDKLPKKVTFMSPRYFMYKHKFRRAIKQENTYVDRKKAEIEQKSDKAIKIMESIKKVDTK